MSKKTTFNEIRLDLTKHDRSRRRINEIKFVIDSFELEELC